jgi:putative PIN family toxin of toxin-antitoxin system
MAWEARRFSVVCSYSLLEEYARVLVYPNIAKHIVPELLRAFQSHLIHNLEIVDPITIQPVCRDPDDDKVIATAIAGGVDYLVTADADLRTPEIVALLQGAGIAIISMDEFINQLG